MTELGEFHQEPQEVIDLGDRLLMIGHMHGLGANRGAAFHSEVAYLVTYSGGRIAREEPFRSHEEAFEAAGIASDSGP